MVSNIADSGQNVAWGNNGNGAPWQPESVEGGTTTAPNAATQIPMVPQSELEEAVMKLRMALEVILLSKLKCL